MGIIDPSNPLCDPIYGQIGYAGPIDSLQNLFQIEIPVAANHNLGPQNFEQARSVPPTGLLGFFLLGFFRR